MSSQNRITSFLYRDSTAFPDKTEHNFVAGADKEICKVSKYVIFTLIMLEFNFINNVLILNIW